MEDSPCVSARLYTSLAEQLIKQMLRCQVQDLTHKRWHVAAYMQIKGSAFCSQPADEIIRVASSAASG